jgi:hypothetical protein
VRLLPVIGPDDGFERLVVDGGFAEIGIGEVCPLKACLLENALLKMGGLHPRALELGSPQLRTLEPHWAHPRVVELCPVAKEPFLESRMPLEEVLPTVSRATVRFRGWDFPHLNPHKPPEYHANYVASSDEFRGHLEYWRAFMSGQFLYLSGVREATEPGWKEKLAHSAQNRVLVTEDFDWSRVPGFIDVVNLVYTITEFFEFAARYVQALPDVDVVGITVGFAQHQGFRANRRRPSPSSDAVLRCE